MSRIRAECRPALVGGSHLVIDHETTFLVFSCTGGKLQCDITSSLMSHVSVKDVVVVGDV